MARHPPRAPGFNYRGLHRYFITVCTFDRRPHFSTAEEATTLSSQIAPIFDRLDFDVIAYSIMPEHVHLLLEGLTDAADLREAMRRWKLRTGYAWRQRHETPLWQTSFQDRVLRDHDDTPAVVSYVLWNPVRAGLAQTPAEYPWIGSSRYSVAALSEHANDWHPRGR